MEGVNGLLLALLLIVLGLAGSCVLDSPLLQERTVADERTPEATVEQKPEAAVVQKPDATVEQEGIRYEFLEALARLLGQGDQIAVLVSAPASAMHLRTLLPDSVMPDSAVNDWKEESAYLQAAWVERVLLRRYGDSPGFVVVDRRSSGEILSEFEFQLSEAVDPETVQRIGRMTGATHIIQATIFRSDVERANDNPLITDSHIFRLIEVSSGVVVASDHLAMTFYDSDDGRRVHVDYTLNGREYEVIDGYGYYK